jgi:hypothetical protein|tara:strand:- start:1362 stop:2045 length:684 start_codon:yes stop_codon:yes gene_type:complete
MKKNILSITLFLIFTTQAVSHENHYEKLNLLKYELFRNNKLIGYHNYEFKRDEKLTKVKSIIEFKVTKLGIDLYKYDAVSVENYLENQLINFSSKTNQNKKIKNTEINFDVKKKELIITGSENQISSPKEYPVGTWWNHEIVQAKAQISAISGRIIEQKVAFIGKEKLTLYGKTYNALRFNFSSSDKSLKENKKLNTDVWYDETSKIWLKAAFNKTGYWEYRLKVHK